VATALHRQGFTAELVERSPTWQTIGAGIMLHGNGVRILRTLGMSVDVGQAGTTLHRWSFCDQQGSCSARSTCKRSGPKWVPPSASQTS
jgi:2-polyprenyl-6-methoxyphenol hydroxylase-like FAD-dependent oxidoreductase